MKGLRVKKLIDNQAGQKFEEEKAKLIPKVVKLYIKGNNNHTFYILSFKYLNEYLFNFIEKESQQK